MKRGRERRIARSLVQGMVKPAVLPKRVIAYVPTGFEYSRAVNLAVNGANSGNTVTRMTSRRNLKKMGVEMRFL